MIRTNAGTAFGREHEFASIDTIEAYRHAVPVRSYADLSPWIRRVASGEGHVLTDDPVVAFEETSGTSSGNKLIPYTTESLASFRKAILPWLSLLAQRRPGITQGPAYVAVSPVTRAPRTLLCGLSIGLPSEAAYLGAELMPALAEILVAPPATRAIDTWRASTLAALVQCRDLAFISVWSPTFLLELIEGVDTAGLWPRLDTISMWTDGASAPFAQRVRDRFPNVHIDSKGLLATESPVTTRLDDEAGCVPALTSVVLEFADETGKCYLAHELRAGGGYRVIVTTPGGLYRYDTADEVRCVSVNHALPRLQFIGRAGLVSDLVGEKLTDGFVTHAIADIRRPAALVPNSAPNPHYELWIDAPDVGDGNHLAESIDASLRQNAQYAYARDLGQLRAPVAIFHPGFMQHRRHTLVAQGQRLGDVKPAALILDRSVLP